MSSESKTQGCGHGFDLGVLLGSLAEKEALWSYVICDLHASGKRGLLFGALDFASSRKEKISNMGGSLLKQQHKHRDVN